MWWLGGSSSHAPPVVARPRARRNRTAGTQATTTTAAPTTTTLPPPPAVAPRVDHVVTTDPVVFITIDDGYHPLPDVLAFLQARQAPVTAFLIAPIAKRDADFYRQVLTLGGTVEDHTMHHPDLGRLSLAQQTAEVCQAADLIGATFGRRPLFTRPPYGTENQFTDQVIAGCGMYVTVLWDAKYSNHQFTLTHPGGLKPGDIILMHWGPGLMQDLQDLFPKLDAAGLRPAPLQDYLGPTATHAGAMPAAPVGPLSE
jgi:peptidoglycan-N-acetylglucosamine deacetylase